MRSPRSGTASVILTAALACGGDGPGTITTAAVTSTVAATGDTTVATAASGTTGTTTGTTTAPGTSGTTTGEITTTATPAATDTSAAFAMMPDMGAPPPVVPCDVWNDTCPEGQKCHPYELDRGWTAGCMPVAQPALPVGATCNVHWGELLDDCERGAICFGLGLFADSYRCTPLATGSADAPICPDPCSYPFVYDDVFGVCNPTCNPLAADCAEGLACNPVAHLPSFLCTYVGTAGPNEACENTDDCAEGTACIPAFLLPNCTSSFCCTPICELGAPDPCPGAIPNTICAAWPPYPDLDPACLPADLGMCWLGS